MFAFTGPTWAGAWTPKAGAGTTISNVALTQDNARGGGQAIELYSEIGLGGDFALVIAPSVAINGSVATNDEILVSVRKRFVETHGWAISGQVGYFEGPAQGGTAPITVTHTGGRTVANQLRVIGYESRVAVGRGFNNGVWLNLESALRTCGSTQGMRWEGTLGRPLGEGKAILKAFGEDSGCAKPRARVQASYVFPLSSTLGIELGWRETFESKDDWQEQAIIIGLWRSF